MSNTKLNYHAIAELVWTQHRVLAEGISKCAYGSLERIDAEIASLEARIQYDELKACGYAEEVGDGDLYWMRQQELSMNNADEHRIRLKYARLEREAKLCGDEDEVEFL